MTALLTPEARLPDRRSITVALVNNMPDSAFTDTEDQFRRAMMAGADGDDVELELYTITELPRSETTTAEIESRYRGLDELWTRPPDALIVTGTEPAQAQLRYEPYWPYLARLLEWAADAVPTTLLSCLAAHASLLLFDGIERTARSTKCSGVFRGAVKDPCHPLAAGLPASVCMPHSRINDVPEGALLESGYRVVVGSESSEPGWSVAARTHRDGVFVLCQGHPEYASISLLREYRRDVRRFLFGRGAVAYPRVPDGYFLPEGLAIAEAFEWDATAPDADPRELYPRFPYDGLAASVKNTWAADSATLYANWLHLAQAALPATV